ncbi:uncharacterized protein [Hemitrygon akajei]|uniref:uncharacterized protein isoform X6 n=1 Tax=Hemitrygon akajei TaxID=2704970 RepID=UPI003BF9D270
MEDAMSGLYLSHYRGPWKRFDFGFPSYWMLLLPHLLLQWEPHSVFCAEDKELVGALGSSVLLDPKVRVDLNKSEILWIFVASHRSPLTILHHIPNYVRWAEPSEQFKSRLQFNQSNGSLIVNRLDAGDEGAYSFTVDDQERKIIQLLLFEKLVEALILPNSTSLSCGSTIQLICNVSGDPHQYQWRKDGGEISQLYQLTDGNKTLVIMKASRRDCGMYTCVATNPVSSIQTDYTLTIHGFPPEDIAVITLSIIVLMISSLFLIDGVLQHCWKLEFDKVLKNLRSWLPSLFICNVVLLVAIFITLICRIGSEDQVCDSSSVTWRVFFTTMLGCTVFFLLHRLLYQSLGTGLAFNIWRRYIQRNDRNQETRQGRHTEVQVQHKAVSLVTALHFFTPMNVWLSTSPMPCSRLLMAALP